MFASYCFDCCMFWWAVKALMYPWLKERNLVALHRSGQWSVFFWIISFIRCLKHLFFTMQNVYSLLLMFSVCRVIWQPSLWLNQFNSRQVFSKKFSYLLRLKISQVSRIGNELLCLVYPRFLKAEDIVSVGRRNGSSATNSPLKKPA